ncbi:MAG: hypothetical protein K6A63_05285 [Acholeplasmatales bacterium]|nr:hypothetical protein [Acholeplasmatales bacterium]
MKKYVKFVGLAFFGLVAFAFLFGVIDALVGLGDLFDVLGSDYIEGYPKFLSFLSWLVGLASAIGMIVVSGLAILKLVKVLSDDESHYAVFPVVLLAGIYACTQVINFIIALLFAINYDYSVGGRAITTLIFAIIVIALLVVTMIIKSDNKLVNICTLLGAWLFVFVLICIAFSGAGGLWLTTLIFFLLATIVAMGYVVFENIDEFKALTASNTNAKPANEAKSEEAPVEAAPAEEAQVEEAEAPAEETEDKKTNIEDQPVDITANTIPADDEKSE